MKIIRLQTQVHVLLLAAIVILGTFKLLQHPRLVIPLSAACERACYRLADFFASCCKQFFRIVGIAVPSRVRRAIRERDEPSTSLLLHYHNVIMDSSFHFCRPSSRSCNLPFAFREYFRCSTLGDDGIASATSAWACYCRLVECIAFGYSSCSKHASPNP